ncbi:MAG: hypothetical protein GXO39_01180 [Thermotogae bacterium]|nr:hypothetical protein [Thermotogota bacterium]
MLYFTPFFQFGTVALTHYNEFIDTLKAEGYDVNNQRVGFGFGFEVGGKLGYLSFGVEPLIFQTSSSNLISDTSEMMITDYKFSHTLINFVFAFPIGISYPLSERFTLFAGVKPMMGISNLKTYDSLHINLGGLIMWSSQVSSMSNISAGMGILFGGDLKLSDRISLNFGLGYDVLSFSQYEGKVTIRYSNGDEEETTAYWVFNPKYKYVRVRPSNQPPNEDEVYAVEDLNGLRIKIGLKIFLGG